MYLLVVTVLRISRDSSGKLLLLIEKGNIETLTNVLGNKSSRNFLDFYIRILILDLRFRNQNDTDSVGKL